MKCPHNKSSKYKCLICHPQAFCKHEKLKYRCKECGKEYCKHEKLKYRCKECGGSSLCKHEKIRFSCKECGINCIHKKLKKNCSICNSCIHNKLEYNCMYCHPKRYYISLQRNRLRLIFKKNNLEKEKKPIEYLGCTEQEFYDYIKSKLTKEMIHNGFHLDHIKPISKFNFENEDERKQCCHYTNIQPLLAEDNLSKSNKWTQEEEIFWRDNIINI